MTTWTRADRIGLTSLAVGIVATIAAWIVVPEFRSMLGLNDATADATTPETTTTTGATSTETRPPAHSKPDYTSAQLTQAGGRPVKVRNVCPKATVAVAVHYRSVDGHWITDGWWVLKPNEERETSVRTVNSVVYFYAFGGGWEWNGNDRSPNALLPVDKVNKFRSIDGQLTAPNTTAVMFYGKSFAANALVFEERLSCP